MSERLYYIGIVITFFLIFAGSMMSVIAQQEPGQTFGMSSDMNTMDANQSQLNTLMERFNQDINNTARSSLVGQIWWGGSALLTGAAIVFTWLIVALTSWATMVDIMFGFAVGTPVFLRLTYDGVVPYVATGILQNLLVSKPSGWCVEARKWISCLSYG